jgi:hypothetical protein
MGYTPNILNKFSTYSYLIKIYMLRELEVDYSNYKSGELIFDSSSIAQYNIQSLEQLSVLSYDKSRHTIASSFNIVVNETNGASLFQYLSNAAAKSGVKNGIVNAKYVIEISFPGRDENNQISNAGLFAIPITFTSVTSQITSTGSTYNINAIEISANAHSHVLGNIKSTISYEGATVGEVFQELETRLNDAEAATLLLSPNAVKRNRYFIKFDDNIKEWKDWKMQFDEEKPGSEDVLDRRQFVTYAGTSLQEFFTSIFMNTEELKGYPVITGTYAAPDSEGSPTNYDLKVLYKVLAIEVDREYDPISGRYAKDITYVIKKHIAPELIVNAGEVSEMYSDSSKQNKRISNILGLGLLTKRYDYLYTGQNTEVINFDINLQNTFYLVAPSMGGQVSTTRLTPSLEVSANRITQVDPNISLRQEEDGPESVANAARIQAARTQAARTQNRKLNETVPSEISSLSNLENFFINEIASTDTTTASSSDQGLKYTFVNDAIDQSNIYASSNDTTTPNVMRLGASLQNLYSGSDLSSIELTIRGDPYWLGKPNSLYLFNTDNTFADYELGSTYFYLNINLPSTPAPSREYFITGVYRVHSVISEFRNGKFIQYLRANRDSLIHIPDVVDTLESGEGVAPNIAANDPLDGSNRRSPASASSSSGSSSRSSGDNYTPDTSQNEGNEVNIPTSANVAEQATQTNVINLEELNLLGVFGRNDRALVRSPDGSVATVRPGDSVGTRIIPGTRIEVPLRVTGIADTSITLDDGSTIIIQGD